MATHNLEISSKSATDSHGLLLNNDDRPTNKILEQSENPEAVETNFRQPSKGPPWYRSQWYILAYILFWGIMNVFFQRNNISIAIVCMVNHTATDTSSDSESLTRHQTNASIKVLSRGMIPYQLEELKLKQHGNLSWLNFSRDATMRTATDTTNSEPIPSTPDSTNTSGKELRRWTILYQFKESKNAENKSSDVSSRQKDSDGCLAISKDTDKREEDGPLIWDKESQGVVLGAIYWTYSALSFPGNILVRKISKKRVIAVSMTVMSLMTLVTHVTALWSPWAVVVIRLVQGACTAVSMISMYGIWVSWAPPEERSGLLSISFSGGMSATAIVFPISGFLCKYGFLGGWPSVFYVFGSIGLLWVFVFVIFTSETPAEHSKITAEERNYIETSLSSTSKFRRTQKIPWKSVLTSRPVWAIVIQQISYNWGLFLIMTTGPQYMREVLKFPIDSNGLYIMLPYLLQYVIGSLSGQIITVLLKKNLLPLIWIRKMGSVIGNVIPAILLLVLSYLDCTQSALAVSLLTLTVGLSGINLNTFFVNPYDIAPQFSQSIMTLSNSIAVANGAIAPYVVAAMTKHKSKSEWQNVFYLSSAILVFGTVVYCIMGSVYLQKWAESSEPRDNGENNGLCDSTDINNVHDTEIVTTKDDKEKNADVKDNNMW